MAGEISALDKHACPACGAPAEWNPAKQKLICPFCGNESPYKIDREIGKVAEHDLASALTTTAAADREFHDQRRTVQCQSCRAIMTYEADRVGQNCEFCGSPALIAYDEIKSPIKPEGVLPFRIDRDRVRSDIRGWWRSKWLAPGKLATAAFVDTVKSLYIPYWTFDASAHCPWEAEAGYYYYVNVPGVDSKGHPVMRRERRVRWEPASGVLDHAFDDELVPGTTGVSPDLLRKIEPFPTGECLPYDTAFLAGHVVEHYQVNLTEAAGDSEAQMRSELEQLCAGQIPGDTYRNLVIQPVFSARTFKHVLVPIWLLVYMFRSKSYQVVVNGYTGQMAGKYPFSGWKIAFLILLALVVVTLIIVGNSNN